MTYYRRNSWGARVVPQGTRMTPGRVQGIALHWPGDDVRRETPAEVMAALRSWQRQHIDSNGWRDIAYQEAVDQAGNTYQLRGLPWESAANGDETTNDHYGALLLVLAIGQRPSTAMVNTVRRRVRAHRRLFPASARIVAHSAIRPDPTACPGDLVRQLLRDGDFEPRRRP